MKKIIALLLALVMCISLTACLSSEGGDEKETESPKPESGPSDLEVGGHSDADNNKACDDCGISVVTTFDFYAINDLHGKFVTSGNTVGVEGLSTYMKQSAALDDNPIFLSSGDM